MKCVNIYALDFVLEENIADTHWKCDRTSFSPDLFASVSKIEALFSRSSPRPPQLEAPSRPAFEADFRRESRGLFFFFQFSAGRSGLKKQSCDSVFAHSFRVPKVSSAVGRKREKVESFISQYCLLVLKRVGKNFNEV